jgi:TetR/AcrR family transcriptional regulator, cholesterol catabolism regulator
METKQRIIQKAHELFFRYGVKAVTMDDVARDLGISKKTIYQHFKDKDEVVVEVTVMQIEQDRCYLQEAHTKHLNIIETLVFMTEMMRQQLATMNPSMVSDVKKYHPMAWDLWQKHKRDTLLGQIIAELREGIAQGFIRAEIEVDILAQMRMEQIEMAFDNQIFPPQRFTSFVKIQLAFLDHFIRGVVTEAGLRQYEALMLRPTQ